MKFITTPLKGNYMIHLEPKEDERGSFFRYFCMKEFGKNELNTSWQQINISTNRQLGTLRGLHYQREPNTEIKLVYCMKGAIWDVVVDLRDDSKTYGDWFGSELSSENRNMMYVPKGFAHGYISLKPNSEILYLVSSFYEPESEDSLIWNDPDVKIDWPLEPKILSDKDKSAKYLKDTIPIIL